MFEQSRNVCFIRPCAANVSSVGKKHDESTRTRRYMKITRIIYHRAKSQTKLEKICLFICLLIAGVNNSDNWQ